MKPHYEGSCFCGSVKIRVSGEPVAMGYCHCDSCRMWAASPINAFTLWQPQAVQITAGEEDVATYHQTPRSYRKWCRQCGGHLLAEHPGLGVIDVYAAVIPTLPFRADLHVNYQESVLHMRDGLPKLRDYPKEMGGSGQTLPE